MRKVDAILLALAIGIIAVRYQTTQIKLVAGQHVQLSGRVTSEPTRYSTRQSVTLHGVQFYLDLYPEVGYGDRIVVEGIVDEEGELSSAKLIEVAQSKPVIYKLRDRVVRFFQHSLPQPHAALVAGMVLGSKSGLPQSFWEELKTTGTAHVVVASGMNVTLVAGFVMAFLLGVMPRKKAIVFALAAIWIYALISGFDAPIVRSAIMGSIAFSAQALGRLTNAFRNLVLSAVVMLLIRPAWVTDLGFILSFVATLSILVFDPKLKPRLAKVPAVIRDDLTTTLAAQIGVAPILYIVFGQFNIFSPLINALVLWTIPPITILGMVAALVSLVWPALASLVLYLVFPLTSLFVWVVGVFG